MLIANGTLHGQPTKYLAGNLGSLAERNLGGTWRGSESAFSTFAGLPTGSHHPQSFLMPQDEGGMGLDVIGIGAMTAAINGVGDVAMNSSGVGAMTANGFITSERTVNMNGVGSMTVGAPSAYGNVQLRVRIGFQPSADENADAVLARPVDGSTTVLQTLSLLLAVATGRTTITNLGGGLATVRFKGVDNTTDRVVANMNGSERTNVTKTP